MINWFSSPILPQPNRILHDNPQKQLRGRLVQLQVNIIYIILLLDGNGVGWNEKGLKEGGDRFSSLIVFDYFAATESHILW